jgi:hypothetical protein
MKVEPKYELGAELRDTITGLEGVNVAHTVWLNGCIRYSIQPRGLDKDGKPRDTVTVDEEQLEPASAARVHQPTRTHGGERPSPTRAADPGR